VKHSDKAADDEADMALFGAPGCFTWRGNVFGQQVDIFISIFDFEKVHV
jgi:hypothetical protein